MKNTNQYILHKDFATLIITNRKEESFSFSIDLEDVEKCKPLTWYNNKGYACTSQPSAEAGSHSGRGKLFLHSYLVTEGEGRIVDHIDGNPLNNRKVNLRRCDYKQNAMNRRNTAKSGYKGVHYINTKPSAYIFINGKGTYIGTYDTVQEAAQAYDDMAVKHFGRFAATNKSMGLI